MSSQFIHRSWSLFCNVLYIILHKLYIFLCIFVVSALISKTAKRSGKHQFDSNYLGNKDAIFLVIGKCGTKHV